MKLHARSPLPNPLPLAGEGANESLCEFRNIEIYLCGGGAHNATLLYRLAALLPECTVKTTDDLGVNGDFLEALAFAWLAQQTLHGKPSNLPQVTGAKHPCVLGAIYPV